MAIITEDYVSFETAKLLKDKGFDVYGDGSLNSGIEVFAEYSPSGTFNKCITSKPHQKAYPAPTLQMAMKWLREACGLIISIEYQDICPTWKWRVYLKSSDKKHTNFQHYNKYEEAAETAIKYCLENLI